MSFEPCPQWRADGIYVTDSSGTRSILNEDFLPVFVMNAYFCDLTGDGIPELCTTLDRGSGITDVMIAVCDYTEGKTYTLENRMTYDYRLEVLNGKLMVVQCEFMDNQPLAYGQLRLVKSALDGECKIVCFFAE